MEEFGTLTTNAQDESGKYTSYTDSDWTKFALSTPHGARLACSPGSGSGSVFPQNNGMTRSILGVCFLHSAIYRQWDPFAACVLDKPMVTTPVYVSRAHRWWRGRKLRFLSE